MKVGASSACVLCVWAVGALVTADGAWAAPGETCAEAEDAPYPARIEATTVGLESWQASSPCGVDDGHARWYRFVVPDVAVEQPMIFTVESDFDTTLALFPSCGGEAILCMDDLPHDLAPRLDPWLTPGDVVFVRVGGWGGLQGDFTLRIEALNASSAPVNDRCEDAVTITQLTPGSAATWNASGTDMSSCGPEDRVDIWYRFVAPTGGEYEIAVDQNQISAHYITLFDDCAGTHELACAFSGTKVTLAAGQEVKIRLGTNPSAADWFNVVVRPEPSSITPPNDSWQGAIPVGVPSHTSASTWGATREAFNWGPDCGPWVQAAIWYEFEAPTSDVYVFDTVGSGLSDTVVAVFEPCDARGDGPPGILECNDFDGQGEHGRIDGLVEAGQRVCIAVAGRFLSVFGDVTLNVTRQPGPPVNDTCAGALPIAAGEQLYGVNYSSRPVDVLSQCPYGNFPLWYEFTAPADGLYKVDTKAGRDAWPDLAIFESCEPAAPIIACSAEDQPALPLRMRRGETVYIRVSTTVWWRGTIPLRIGPAREPEVVEPGPEVVEGEPVIEEAVAVESTEPEVERDVEVVAEAAAEVVDAAETPDVESAEPTEPEVEPVTGEDTGCGCSGGGSRAGWLWGAVCATVLAWLRRRGRGVMSAV